MGLRRTPVRAYYALAFLLLSVLLLEAQEITGNIRGTVKDSTGAVIAGASVKVTNTDRNQVVRDITTNSGGDYVAPLLPVGHYSVTIEASGFAPFTKTGIELNVSDRLTVDATLNPGSTQTSVNVEANPLQVNLENASQEGLISGVQVRQLPLNNRNYEQLVTLQPGVTSNAADQLYVGTTSPQGSVNIVAFAINGQRQSQNNWTIDGADNLDHGSNITLLVYPSVDAITEFKVLRSNYAPEFGRSASGQINVITRSGESNFHGSLYEYFRNDYLNANNSYNNHVGLPRNVLRYNDFGGTFGGPIFIPGHYNKERNKTFFFFSEEARRVTTPVTETAIVPTQAQLQGIFSSPVCTAVDASGNCTAVGNTITNINPISRAYIKDIFSHIPTPAADGTLVTHAPGVFNYREEVIRGDHVVNSKIALMGRYINDDIPTKEPYGLFGPQSAIPGVANTSTNSPGRSAMGRITMQLSNRMFNELGYAYSYGAITSDPTGLLNRANSPDIAAAVQLPYAVTLDRVPNISWEDTLSNVGGFGAYRDYNRNHNVFDNFSLVVGKHSFRFGFDFNHYQKEENAAGNNVGTFGFGSECQGASAICNQLNPKLNPAVNRNALDIAYFLLGYANSATSQSPTDITADVRQNLYEGYAQDEWRVKSNFTLTYGIRYSYFTTPYAGNGMLTTFDPTVYASVAHPQVYTAATAPSSDLIGYLVPGTGTPYPGLIIGDHGSPYGKYITQQDKKNFAPRVGFAWDPFSNGKTSIRGGYGIFYDSVAAGLIEDNVFNNPPFLGNANLGSGLFLSNLGSASGIPSGLPPSIWTTDPRWHTPYSQEWNFGIQQELAGGMLLDLGYVGTKGTHLTGVQDINQVLPGAAVAAGVVAPGAVYPGGTRAGEELNAYRPYVGWGSIGQITPSFDSNYNALQASVQKRFGHNSLLNIAYTWSHGMTDNQTDRSTGLQNTYCRVCDYGPSQLDRRHVFTANYVYDLPWLRDSHGVAGYVLGGWEASGILTVNSGLPLTVLTSRSNGDPAASGLNVDGAPNNGAPASPRPNQIGDPNVNAPKTWNQFFDTSMFVNPTVAQIYGGTERRGAVTGPGLWRYDMSLTKAFRITEGSNLQFRAEAFNLFNHTNFNGVGTTLGSATYGRVLSTRDPRIMQLALRFAF